MPVYTKQPTEGSRVNNDVSLKRGSGRGRWTPYSVDFGEWNHFSPPETPPPKLTLSNQLSLRTNRGRAFTVKKQVYRQ